MDDDLRRLGWLLAVPDPSADGTERGRRALERAIVVPGPRRLEVTRRRPRAALGFVRDHGIAFGGGFVAAAAAVAVAVTATSSGPGARPTMRPSASRGGATTLPPQAAPSSGQRILLVAATVAANQPATTGTYWHVKKTVHGGGLHQTAEWWVGHDGSVWANTPGDPPGTIKLSSGPSPFNVGAALLTFGQIEALPTDASALKAWATQAASKAASESTKSTVTRDPRSHLPAGARIVIAHRPSAGDLVVETMLALVREEPTPPAVRAAAFRVLASLPGVRDLGPADGGERLQIAASSARNYQVVVDGASLVLLVPGNLTETITGVWTDTLPTVIH